MGGSWWLTAGGWLAEISTHGYFVRPISMASGLHLCTFLRIMFCISQYAHGTQCPPGTCRWPLFYLPGMSCHVLSRKLRYTTWCGFIGVSNLRKRLFEKFATAIEYWFNSSIEIPILDVVNPLSNRCLAESWKLFSSGFWDLFVGR